MSITCPFNNAHPSILADQARRLADALDRIAADIQPSASDLADAPVIDCWKPATRFAPALIGVV